MIKIVKNVELHFLDRVITPKLAVHASISLEIGLIGGRAIARHLAVKIHTKQCST